MGKRAVQVSFGFLFLYSIISFLIIFLNNVFRIYFNFYEGFLSLLSISTCVILVIAAIGLIVRFFETLEWTTGLQMFMFLIYGTLYFLPVGGLLTQIAFLLFLISLAVPLFGENTLLAGLLILAGAAVFLQFFPYSFVLWIIRQAVFAIGRLLMFVAVLIDTE